jgi:hypothetical protein
MMTNSEKTGHQLYQNLGKLFYAIAMADDAVHIKELDRLKEIVREKWLDVDSLEDRYGTDAAYEIEIVFDWLLEYEKQSDACYDAFAKFYKEHPTIFTEDLKDLIMASANAIAASFSGKNKAELVMLGKLGLLLK